MKKIIYLAPLVLLSIGAKTSANQVPTHISNALRIYEQENRQSQPVGQSENKQVKPTFSNNQKQPIGKVGETTHISRLDSGLIDKSSSVENRQASQVMKISSSTIPTKQGLNESKDSVAGQYVQVQQTRVAQFNDGSKIYGLNNSDQLSKNNGDGYVITNAGMYNGRAVDIGVVVNNIKDKKGSYTTKWSNGDKSDITGEVDNQFTYQNGVLVGINSQPQFDPNKTRMHTIDFPYKILLHNRGIADGGIQQEFTDDITNSVISNYEDSNSSESSNHLYLPAYNGLLDRALREAIADDINNHGYDVDYVELSGHRDGSDISDGTSDLTDVFPDEDYLNKCLSHIGPSGTVTALRFEAYDNGLDIVSADHVIDGTILIGRGDGKLLTPVTNALQLDQVNNGSLSYDYTVGVYDAQTGELIKDLTANYRGKTGKTATDQDTTMNSAVKAKIQAINADTANSAYTGTIPNDDVTFSKNTVHVNYVDKQGQPINVPGYDIDVDNLTSGNYQVPQNYALVNTNGFKVTKNTHEVNGVAVTDSYNFIDQGNNKVTDNGRTLSVVLAHGTTNVGPDHSGLSNDATANTFVINNGTKKQINSQSRHFGASGVLDLVTKKITKQGDWQLSGKSNFDQTNINNDLVGYGNAIHNNLTFLTL